MTTATLPATPAAPTTLRRIGAVTKLQFVNRFSIVWLPLIVLGIILLANIIIWYLILSVTTGKDHADASKGFSYTGAVFWIFVYMLVVAVQAIARTFPFALGYGVTRRNYWLGSALAFVILAVFFSLVLTVLSLIEQLTNGWGAGGHMFSPTYFTSDSLALRFVIYLFVFLFFLFFGSAVAAVFVRWRATGMVVFFGGVGFLLIGLIAIVTLGHHWGEVGRWFDAAGTFGLAAWSLVISAISALGGFLILRKATPKG